MHSTDAAEIRYEILLTDSFKHNEWNHLTRNGLLCKFKNNKNNNNKVTKQLKKLWKSAKFYKLAPCLQAQSTFNSYCFSVNSSRIFLAFSILLSTICKAFLTASSGWPSLKRISTSIGCWVCSRSPVFCLEEWPECPPWLIFLSRVLPLSKYYIIYWWKGATWRVNIVSMLAERSEAAEDNWKELQLWLLDIGIQSELMVKEHSATQKSIYLPRALTYKHIQTLQKKNNSPFRWLKVIKNEMVFRDSMLWFLIRICIQLWNQNAPLVGSLI